MSASAGQGCSHNKTPNHHGESAPNGVDTRVDGTPPPPPPPAANNTAGKKGAAQAKKKPLDPSEVNNLLTAKISQLETEHSVEEEEDKQIARAVRKANKDLADLINQRDTHVAKLELIQQKYTELLHEQKKMERDHAKLRKRSDQLQKEKDQARSDVNKVTSMKNKLETLCRELQKENKRIKDAQDESKRISQNEHQKREDLSSKFDNTVWDIKRRIQDEEENATSRKSQIEADELMRLKFRSFVEQFELREAHFYSLLRTKELDVQLNLCRYDHQRKLAEAEALRAKALSAQVSTFSQTEAELRSQLNIYVEKFKQVEDTLNNSNDLFLTFRKEMEEMSKKTKRLEKDNLQLTRKTELMNRNILEMAEERTRREKELADLKKKYSKIEGICRALQNERGDLQAQLRVQGVDPNEDDEEDDEEGEEDDEDDEDYSGSEDLDEEGSDLEEDGEEDEDLTEDESQAMRAHSGNAAAAAAAMGNRRNGNAMKAVATSANPIHIQKGVVMQNGTA